MAFATIRSNEFPKLWGGEREDGREQQRQYISALLCIMHEVYFFVLLIQLQQEVQRGQHTQSGCIDSCASNDRLDDQNGQGVRDQVRSKGLYRGTIIVSKSHLDSGCPRRYDLGRT